jgi:hypothetical protein
MFNVHNHTFRILRLFKLLPAAQILQGMPTVAETA